MMMMIVDTTGTMMIKYPDWNIKLNQYFLDVRDNKFQYGKHDCCTFICGAIEVMTGEDIMSEYRGNYNSKRSGAKAIKDLGQGTLLKTLIKKLGKSQPGVYGNKGDIAWYNNACGLVLGRESIFISEVGYTLIATVNIDKVFRV
jgi:hypothetical protein